MVKNNKNKTAIVTGAASGIGLEFTHLLAKDNYNLVLVDVDYTKLNAVKIKIEKEYNINTQIIVSDLSKVDSAKHVYSQINSKTIDVLINNAGFGVFGSFSNTSWSKEANMLHLHVITVTQLTKLVLQNMEAQNSGKILNVSSLAAFMPGPMMALYYASKSYLLSFSEAIANELKHTGITVTALCPGQTNTGFQDVVSSASTENKINFNIACPNAVAVYGYKAMHKGRVVAIPGMFNKFLATLPRFLTRNRVRTIVRNVQDKNRNSKNNKVKSKTIKKAS
ncbi:SDR family oxidoreductase [Lacinutrix sp. 5H-3-7-4]|uniref:SDR family NAD(P)-dependent oxidoreductase n=1 Tax=Lacinutrix sp. (strain 5H-3-7-4) TaxID=983544 RepID=UPI00020A3C49|nr:SDR family oxidoreductase [Lacinutrix sp. 5H-3-7-4]AEH01619.1 short-chain dehydrogenase/reductase SDR [Lacinutrix sp. 5H-3-7-4]